MELLARTAPPQRLAPSATAVADFVNSRGRVWTYCFNEHVAYDERQPKKAGSSDRVLTPSSNEVAATMA
jgi:hypothetical protein